MPRHRTLIVSLFNRAKQLVKLWSNMSETLQNDVVCHLNSLINRSLHQFTKLNNINSTPDIHKQLLISLSQIIRQIRRWINRYDSEHQQQSSICLCFDSQSAEHRCLANTVSILISLLNVDNKYTQHLVSNVFLVISEFLLAREDNWDNFIRLLCVSFEFGLCNVLQPSFSGVENMKTKPENSSPILHNINWTGVAGLIGVLRGILKHLKGEDVELMVIILDSLSTSLLGVPWDVLNGVKTDSSTDVKASSSDGNIEAKTLFMGILVQLLCSLVGLAGSVEPGTGSLNKNAILKNICDLVPKILRCCLAEDRSFIHGHILAYLQHKFLMLMIRLSFHMQLDRSTLLLWLQLLHEYFQDLLSRHLSVVQCSQDDCLEGSPFLLSLDDQEASQLSLRHLQRQTVFFFVRCCLSLIDPRNSSDLTVAVKSTSCLIDCDSITADNYFARKKGLLEFYGWLQGKVSFDICSENQMCLKKCIKFTTSFITLYMYEDDMLFEVLLQMLTLSPCPETMFSKDGRSSDSEEDILFYISVLFNPLLVLHVFLAELQYDHQLLLDYLISKDTGSKCAEYLLRSLRIICDSWDLSLQLLDRETCFCQRDRKKTFKRTRAFLEDSCAEQVVTPLHRGHTVSFEYEKEYQLRNKLFGNCSIRIQDAKACLRSLKSALIKLHKKKLFPYNPKVLIRGITRFEDLCDQHV